MTRSIIEAAKRLSNATEKELRLIVKRDPDMIRDIARSIVKSWDQCVVPGKQIAEE